MATDLLIPTDASTLALLAGGGRLTLPFGHDILLLNCTVAGTAYRPEEVRLAAAAELEPGAELRLVREPGNAHDGLAIRVLDGADRHLGYLPRQSNPVIARLMDAGKHLVARLTTKNTHDDWLRLDIEVLLREL